MASAGSIFVDLLLRDANFVAGLNRSRRGTSNFSSGVQGDMGKVRQSFASVLSPVNNVGTAIARLSGILAGALSTQKLVQYSDTWRQLEGRLSIVSSSFGEVVQRQEDLFEVAQRTRQPLEGIMSFYTRLTQFIPEAERAQYDLLGVTESIATALAITGETGASATAAMIQFTQAIGTNFEAAGQELRSLQEQAPRLTKALVDALGGGTKSLQQLKEEGILTRESVLNALSGMGEQGKRLREELENVSLTVGQAFGRLDNAFLKLIGQSDAVRGGTSSLAQAINLLAQNLDLVVKAVITLAAVMTASLIPNLLKIASSFVALVSSNVSYAASLAAVTSATALSVPAFSTAATANAALAASMTSVSGAAATVNVPLIAATASVSRLGVAAGIAGVALANLGRIAGVALAAIGGIPGLIAIAVTAIFVFREEILKAADNINIFGTTAGQVFRDIGEGASIIFNGVKAIVLGTIAGIIEALKGLEANVDLMTYNIIQTLNKIPGINISADDVLADLSKPGAFESSQRTIGENFKRGWDRVSEDISNYMAESLNPQQPTGNISQTGQTSLFDIGSPVAESLEKIKPKLDKNKEDVDKWQTDITQLASRAAQNMESAFSDFLFDPFENGLRGLLKSWVDTLRRMAAEAASSRLFDALGSKLGGGGLGGLLGGLFGGGVKSDIAASIALNSVGPNAFFADGGYLGPGQFGIAGEAGAELIYGGKTGVSVFNQDQIGRGGNTYNIDARGADQAAVARLEQSLIALAGPGVIEQRVNNAQVRGLL